MTHRSKSASMVTRRQFLALAGGMTVAGLAAACSPAPAPADTGAAGPTGSEAATELIAWFTDRRTINEMTEKEAIPDFESKNPNIRVSLQFVPEAELQQKLLTANAAGNAPDVSSIDETFLDTLTKQEVLRPIPDEVINVSEEMGELTAFLYRLPQGADDGRYYGLPNGVFSAALFYNAGLLAELGYSPEDIPSRWDDFLLWAKEVTQWDGETLVRGGLGIFANEFSIYEDLRYQLAGPIDGNPFPTKDSIRLADEVGVQAWEFIMGIYNEHRLDSIAEGIISRDRFGAGNAVTLYNWTWFNGQMETQYPEIDWGILIPPSINGEPPYGRRGPDVGFTLTTQNDAMLDAAITFYRYLLSPDYLSKYCKLRGIQPSLRAMWEDPAFSEESGPRWAAIAIKNRPENSVDAGFWPLELVDITNRITPAIRDEGEDITTVLQREEQAGNEFLNANPQWSILSAADYEANPQWLTVVG
ncbi:MAG TPA: extracellular solute-binding protein [Caldilineaceae bacterium]|nr:extracellular solute-binding protein [Caldilineaceae bacterium]